MNKSTLIMLVAGWVLAAAAAEPRCPLIPMGAITGKPDERTVRETLEAYKAVGIDQYLIYARSGLEWEYMGEDWMRMCEWFCQHAKRLGMSIWLYDEYNWPSGSCKGRVPAENPAFESRQNAVYRDAAGAYEWKIVHSPGWVDNYSFKAMERFIELTHKKYEQRLAPYLGSTVAGIFTDEPAHPVPARPEGKPILVFRHFDGAEDEYRARTGRELRSDVEAFLSDKSKDEVWAVYSGLLGDRFRKAYFDPIRAWCDRVGLLSTGHLIAENSTRDSALFNGNPLHALKGLTLPGMDEIGTRCEPAHVEWLTFAVAQHAIGRRGKGGLAELFALGPADMPHSIHRQMIWLCALHKVDRYLLAIAPLDARGNLEKSGYFNPWTRTQPWFPALRLLGEEARVAARFAARSVRCDIAIRYPQAACARLAMRGQTYPLLLATLRSLSAQQLTYDLYEEDEPCDKPLVFAFDGTALREERSGRVLDSPEAAGAFAKSICPPTVWVETADGKSLDNLLLRSYEDGSVAVLALGSAVPGSLRLMRRGGEPVPFELPARGVWTWEGGKPSHEKAAAKPIPLSEPSRYDVTAGGCGALRLVFGKDNTARIEVGEALEAVRLAVRNDPEPIRLTFDGKPVTADLPCDTVPQGFRELCRQTEPFRLEPGVHTLAIASGAGDTKYFLPVAWLTGGFAVENGILKAFPKSVPTGALWKHGLANFAGTLNYTAQVEVPAGAGSVRLRLNTGGLFTAMSLGGQALGERAWEPFEWKVPAELQGKKAELKITLSTSVAPLFGDWKDPQAAWDKKFWVPPPEPHPEIGLLSAPEWVLIDTK